MISKIYKYIQLLCISHCIAYCQGAGAGAPIIPLTDFKGDFTEQFYNSGSHDVISVTGQKGAQVLKIKEAAKAYVSGKGIVLNKFSGMKSLYLSVSVKTVDLAKSAAVFYYWIDADGKHLCAAKYFVRVSGNHEWGKYEKVISSPAPLKTAGIKVYYAVYRAKGEGYALFKEPVIRIANEKDQTQAVSKPEKRESKELKVNDKAFKHGMSAKPVGCAYNVERGGCGWLLMHTAWQLQEKNITLKVIAPTSTDFELYLSDGKKAIFRPGHVEAKAGSKTFTFGPLSYVAWRTWGNSLFFKVGKDIPEKFNIKLYFYGESGALLYKKSIPVQTIAALPFKKIQGTFESRMFYAYPLRRIDFSDSRSKLPHEIIAFLKERGVTSFGYLEFAYKSLCPTNKNEIVASHHLLPYRVNSPGQCELLKKCCVPMAMDVSGLRSQKEFEPEAIAKKGKAYYSSLLNKYGNDRYRNERFIWFSDYEPYAFEGPVTKFSYAPESIQAFRRFAGIPASVKLTPEIILSKYLKKWVKFRCQQRAELIKVQSEALKEYAPKAVFAFCSMPMPAKDENQLKYFQEFGIDSRLIEPYVDLFMPMIYGDNALFYRRAEATVAQLKKPVYVTITAGYDSRNHRPKRLFRTMVGSAFIGAKGIYHWPGLMEMDAEFIRNNQKAMQLIPEIEPFIGKSKLITAENFVFCPEGKPEDFYCAVRSDGKTYMVFLANEGKSRTCYPRIKIPSSIPQQVTELVKAQKLSPEKGKEKFPPAQLRKGISIELPPRSIRLLLVGNIPLASSSKFVAVDAQEIENKAAELREKMNGMSRNESANGMSYKLDSTTLCITTPAQVVAFKMDDCAVGNWKITGKEQDITLLSSFGIDFFDYPLMMRLSHIPAELEEIKIGKDYVLAVTYFKVKAVPYDGLAIRKTFVISRDKPEIDVCVRIIPAGGYRQFAYRANSLSGDSSAMFKIDGSKVKVERFGNLYTRDDFKMLLHVSNVIERGHFNADNCELYIPGAKLDIICSFNKDVKAVMSWHDSNVNTMELIYDKVYQDNDPHKIREWECSYKLQLVRKK